MPRRRRRPLPPGFGTIWATVAVDLVGFGIVLPILPLYARNFHLSSFTAALLVAVFSAASFVCSPLWGRLSDRFGRKPVLVVSLAGTTVGSLLTGLATGLPLLLLGRIVDGASGASVAVARAAAADLSAPEERSRLFGLLGAAFGLGFVGGPAIGALAALGGARLPFFVAAGITALNTLAALRRLPETLAAPPGRGGSGVTHSGQQGAPRGGRPAPLAADEAPPSPSPARHRAEALTGGRGVLPLLLVAFAATTAFSAFEATFALFGQRHLGFGIASAAGVFAAAGAVIVVVQGTLVHPAVARFGEARVLLGGLLLDAAGLGLLAPARAWSVAAPALLLLTVGQGLAQTTMTLSVTRLAEPARRGQALGAQQSASGLARMAGPAAGGALLGAAASGTPYLLGAGLAVAAAVLAAVAARSGLGLHPRAGRPGATGAMLGPRDARGSSRAGPTAARRFSRSSGNHVTMQ